MYRSNYILESDDDYELFHQDSYFYNKQKSNKKVYLIIATLVVFSIIIFALFNIYNKDTNKYLKLENEMVDVIKNYIFNNDIKITRDSYFLASDFNIKLEDDCNLLSGVMVSLNGDYNAYLACNDYHTNLINNQNKYIDLLGDDVVFASNKELFVEPGYKSDYEVKVNSNVKKETGFYEINYNVIDNNEIKESIKRYVVVLEDDVVNVMYPTISLEGSEIVYLDKNSEYQELGYMATDSLDGDLKNKVIIKSDIDLNNEGTYYIDYIVTNSRGFTKGVKRIVNIVDNDTSSLNIDYYITPNNAVNDKKIINFYISGNNYNYTLLPNNNISSDTFIKYEVLENGYYKFDIYDKNNQMITKIIEINNIDKDLPTVTCNAELYNGYILINASGSDTFGVLNYEYLVDGNTSNPISSTSYSMSLNEANSVKVKITDIAGNVNESVCEITDKRVAEIPKTPHCMDNIIYKGKKYPLTEAQKKKLAAMVTAEYGSDIVGMKMVASHMANLYEYKKWRGAISSSKTFYNYISTTTWYASRTRAKTNYSNAAMDAVEQCIVNGDRTLPLYIDEFDWFPNDIKGAKKIDEYVRLETPVKNIYGASGKFWCVSQNSRKTDANIFFYTSDKYKELVG